MCIDKFCIYPRRAVLVRCMPDIIFAVLNQCYGKAYNGILQKLKCSTKSAICTLYNSWLIGFEIWNHWIKSLYTG